VLRHHGLLTDGQVNNIVVESSRATILSQIIRLQLTYDSASPEAPHSVILKAALPDRDWNAGAQEVAFYTQVASAMSGRLVPRCFDVHSDEQRKTWHLLLEDLAESHFIATTWPLLPTMEQCATIVEARARFQAAWWDDPRLGASVGTWSDPEATNRRLQDLAAKFERFSDRLGDNLPPERRRIFERLFSKAPRLLTRYHARQNLTIVQGDAHV
jgi:hypothetical protein